ncbi:hypothetical protein HAX54_049468 [Datura stramonium]|uniref:beta-galactosidase n=1 Tax=Datura stramonium TaxID=4076 RepID=A0ABS8SV42_DATST|nr:hypothetical protein [Datura stramonium]
MMRINVSLLLFVVFFSLASSSVRASLTYDDRAILINGKRRILISGYIHYPRSTPEMWPDLIQKAKDGGLDVIETCVFWNGHEPSPGKSGFWCRGFPVWLKYVPGIKFRADNQPFKVVMQGFVEKIVNMMKSENLFEPQGGPIIMAQIENEYGPVEWEIGAPGKPYGKWAAEMAVSLDTGVPWITCKQEDAPDPVILAMVSTAKILNLINPANLKCGQKSGLPVPRQPAEDVAFAVARFIQNNGSFFNYYMHHRGTNFGRTAAGRFIATSFDYDAPLDEYGAIYGGWDNPKLTYSGNVKLRAGINKISMLSVAVGLPNVGLHFETWNAGVLGPVTLSGLNEGTRDLTKQRWAYKVGLKGETLSLYTLSGSSSVKWVKELLLAQKQPLTWYKATFDAPEGNDPLALDMGSMGKGQIWINGKGVGRHWPGYVACGNCGECNYAGLYSEKKCQTNCDQPSQRWYHVPRSWLKPRGNQLVVYEEWGGDPVGISFTRRSTARVCADIVGGQPSLKNWHAAASGKSNYLQPKAQLWCPAG